MKISALWELYKLRPGWTKATNSTRRIYYQSFEYIEEFMDMDADKITRPMVLDFRDRHYDERARCRMGVKMLALLMQFGYDRGYCKANPARGINGMPPKVGWLRWDKEEVEAVLGSASTPIRNAIILALYTGQRRSDIARMRWDNYDGKFIHVIQQKTRKPLAIPVHPLLKVELERMANENVKGSPYILTTSSGVRWSPDYLSTRMTKEAKAAGVTKVLHGLRKTTASLLAELGCTPYEIAAITGQSLREVFNYTRVTDQKALAQKAMDRWSEQYA